MCCCKPQSSHSEATPTPASRQTEAEAPGSVEALTTRVAQLESELRNRRNS